MKDPKLVLRHDIQVSLLTWLMLEILCFAVMPLTTIYSFAAVEPWVLPSILFGVLGSVIVGLSSSVVVEAQAMVEVRKKLWRRWLATALSLVGFVGISFPLSLTLVQFWQTLQAGI